MRNSAFIFLIVPLMLLAIIAPCLCLEPPQAQNKQPTAQHEVTVTLKLVQAYVTDKKGNSILDLKKDDFIIYDNGKSQPVTEFEKHILSVPSVETDSKSERAQEMESSASRKLLNRRFFLLFDFAFNNPKGILKAKEAALKFIDTKLTQFDELGLLSYSVPKSLVLHEYLTTDHEKVRKVVESFGLKETLGRAENLEVQYWRELIGVNPLDASKRGGVADKEKEAEEFELIRLKKNRTAELSAEALKFFTLAGTRLHALNFISKMRELASALRYISGYKHVILFSSGIPHSLAYGIQAPFGETTFEGNFGDSLLREKYEDMLKEMAASNSTLYTLDTEDAVAKIASDVRMRGAFSLMKMANATGGKYFGNINNYEKHLERIQNLTGCFYVLGYYIDEKWDGKYHEIKVEVRRPGYEVYAQKGYFNPKPFSEYNKMEKMLHLVDLALADEPFLQTPVRFPLVALPCSIKGKSNLAFFASLPVEKLQDISGEKTEIVSLIFDNEDNIVKTERNEVELSTLPKGRVYYCSLISLPPGAYKSRLVVRNLETGKGAVGSAAVSVPGAPGAEIKLYPPLLLKEQRGSFYLRNPYSVYPFDTARYSPVMGQIEKGTKSLFAVLRCSFSGIQDPEIKLSASLIHRLNNAAKKPPAKVLIHKKYHEEDTDIFLIELQTGELKPGEYFLYLLADEGKTQSGSRLSIPLKVE